MPDEADTLQVEVAYALPQQQWLFAVHLPEGATVADALARCRLAKPLSDLDLKTVPIGIFGRLCARDTRLRQGDRVEIYRPLRCDPKETRRLRAAQTPTKTRR